MAFWTILTTALSLLSSISATPVNPVFHAGQGRNIQPLHCVSKTTKESGVCMFAWNCLKANGTHLGTCIDRFYFGSCCMIKDQQALILTTTKPPQTQSEAEANPNAIDQNPVPEVWPVENVKFPTVAVGVSTTAPVPSTGLPVSPVSTQDSVAASTSSEKPASGSSSAAPEKTTSKINAVSTAPTVLPFTTKNPELTSTTVKAEEKVTEKPISATVEPLANISTPAPSAAIIPSTFAPPSALPSVISTQAPIVTSTELVLSTKEPEISPNLVDAVVQISGLAEVPTTPAPSLSPGMESSAPNESVSVSTDGAEQASEQDVPPGAKPVPVLINVQSSVPDSATTPHFENAHPLQVDISVQSSISPLGPTTVETVSEEEAATQVDLEALGVDEISPSELSPSVEVENVAEEETTVTSQTSSMDMSMAVSISQTPASGISTKVPDLAPQPPATIGEIDVAPATTVSLTGRPISVISTEVPKMPSSEFPPQQSSTVLPVLEPTMVDMEETTDKGEDVGTAGVPESTTDVPTALVKDETGTPPQAPESSSSAPADPSPMTSAKPTEVVTQRENSTTSKPPSTESDKSPAPLETTTHSTTVLLSSGQPISMTEVVLSSLPGAPETTVGPSTKGSVTTTQPPSSSANVTTSKPSVTQAPATNAKTTEIPTTTVSATQTTTIIVSFSQSPTTFAEGTELAGTTTKTAEAPQTTVVITEQPVTFNVTEPTTTGLVSEPSTTTAKDAELPVVTEKSTEPPRTTDEAASVPSTSVEATMPPSTTTSSTEQPTTTAKVVEPSTTTVKVTEQPTTTIKVIETPTTAVKVTQPPVTTAKITETPSTTATVTESPTTTVKVTEPPKTQPVTTTIVTTSTTTVLPTTTTTEALPDDVIPPYDPNDYKKVCGKPVFPQARIVNGETAAFGQWPWQISLRQWKTATFLHKCGAALLNENWAITAAHCVDNVQPEDILLRMGEYDLASENEPYNYTERRVQIVASHPKFDPRTFEYDLALLRFYDPVPFQPNIIPICIPEGNETYVGKTGYVTGWGRLYEDGPLPSKLQQVTVPIVTNSECEGMYRRAGYVEHIPGIFICAGYSEGKRDSCEGDSGGPMVIKNGDHWILGGVISWGIGCAEPNQPGVYTRITAFKDWINQIIVF